MSSWEQFVRRFLEWHVRFAATDSPSKPMSTQIFITLPVVNLPRALAFYEAIGYSRNAEFTNDTAACLIISEPIHLMLLTHAKFGEFPPKEICDTSKALQVLHSLTCESRTRVDAPHWKHKGRPTCPDYSTPG